MNPEWDDAKSFWDRRADAWQRRAEAIDAHLALYGRRGVAALRLRLGERVLDVGCGTGYGTDSLADRVGPDGRAVGIDISPAMIHIAQRNLGRDNIRFEVADAQTAALHGFDAALARFALGLFDDTVGGVANIRRALLPGGRFASVDWGPRQHNAWMLVPRGAVAELLGLKPPAAGGDEDIPDALARANAQLIQGGFTPERIEVVHAARRIRHAHADQDITAMFEEGGGFSDLWPSLDPATQQACIKAVVDAMTPYRDGAGWALPGCAILATGINMP